MFIFKVTEPSSIPYRTHSACAKRAAYPVMVFPTESYGTPVAVSLMPPQIPYGIELGSVTLKINNQQRDSDIPKNVPFTLVINTLLNVCVFIKPDTCPTKCKEGKKKSFGWVFFFRMAPKSRRCPNHQMIVQISEPSDTVRFRKGAREINSFRRISCGIGFF